LYFFSLAVHAMRHPVYHCNDTCQSVSSLDALAGVPVADCCQPHSSGLDMLKHSLGIIVSRSSSKHGQFVRTSPNMAIKVLANWPCLLLLRLTMIPRVLLQLLVDRWNLQRKNPDIQTQKP